MADLGRYYFYHGTSLSDAEGIRSKQFIIPKPNPNNKRDLGSLGHGAYAFANSFYDACVFANRNTKNNGCACVIKFEIKRIPQILDLTLPKLVKLLNRYTIISNAITQLRKEHNQNSGKGKVQQLDGAFIDSFIIYINKQRKKFNKIKKIHKDKVYLGVYNLSLNSLGGDIAPDTILPNSMELCIMNNSIVDYSTMSLLVPPNNKKQFNLNYIVSTYGKNVALYHKVCYPNK